MGLRSDLYGLLVGILEAIGKVPDLVVGLSATELSDEHAARVVGKIGPRATAEIARVATEMQSEGALSAEDVVDGLG